MSNRKKRAACIPSQWWKHSPPTDVTRVRFQPAAKCGLRLLFGLALHREFFSVSFDFPSFTQTNISISQFNQNRGSAWKPANADVVSFLTAAVYFIYLETSPERKFSVNIMSVWWSWFSFFLYSRKRKSGNYELEDLDAASDLSEKDRMLREKEAEVLNWLEIISFYSLLRKRIIITKQL